MQQTSGKRKGGSGFKGQFVDPDEILGTDEDDYHFQTQPKPKKAKKSTHSPGAAPDKRVKQDNSGRTRPTNNQLLYKAYFRWPHYPFIFKPGCQLPLETDACPSVTAAFLQVLQTLHAAEQMRSAGTMHHRSVLQILSTNTRRTKVVELSSGTHRVPDELKKHYLSDGEGGQYSTNLDRNRYGNDDNYLFTVIRYDLEFLGLCPCMVDVEIIDAKAGNASVIVSAGVDACTCQHKPETMGYPEHLPVHALHLPSSNMPEPSGGVPSHSAPPAPMPTHPVLPPAAVAPHPPPVAPSLPFPVQGTSRPGPPVPGPQPGSAKAAGLPMNPLAVNAPPAALPAAVMPSIAPWGGSLPDAQHGTGISHQLLEHHQHASAPVNAGLAHLQDRHGRSTPGLSTRSRDSPKPTGSGVSHLFDTLVMAATGGDVTAGVDGLAGEPPVTSAYLSALPAAGPSGGVGAEHNELALGSSGKAPQLRGPQVHHPPMRNKSRLWSAMSFGDMDSLQNALDAFRADEEIASHPYNSSPERPGGAGGSDKGGGGAADGGGVLRQRRRKPPRGNSSFLLKTGDSIGLNDLSIGKLGIKLEAGVGVDHKFPGEKSGDNQDQAFAAAVAGSARLDHAEDDMDRAEGHAEDPDPAMGDADDEAEPNVEEGGGTTGEGDEDGQDNNGHNHSSRQMSEPAQQRSRYRHVPRQASAVNLSNRNGINSIEVLRLRQECDRLREEVARLTSDLQSARQELKDQMAKQNDTNRIQELESDLAATKQEAAAAAAQNKALEDRLASAKQELEQSRQEVGGLVNKLAASQKQQGPSPPGLPGLPGFTLPPLPPGLDPLAALAALGPNALAGLNPGALPPPNAAAAALQKQMAAAALQHNALLQFAQNMPGGLPNLPGLPGGLSNGGDHGGAPPGGLPAGLPGLPPLLPPELMQSLMLGMPPGGPNLAAFMANAAAGADKMKGKTGSGNGLANAALAAAAAAANAQMQAAATAAAMNAAAAAFANTPGGISGATASSSGKKGASSTGHMPPVGSTGTLHNALSPPQNAAEQSAKLQGEPSVSAPAHGDHVDTGMMSDRGIGKQQHDSAHVGTTPATAIQAPGADTNLHHSNGNYPQPNTNNNALASNQQETILITRPSSQPPPSSFEAVSNMAPPGSMPTKAGPAGSVLPTLDLGVSSSIPMLDIGTARTDSLGINVSDLLTANTAELEMFAGFGTKL